MAISLTSKPATFSTEFRSNQMLRHAGNEIHNRTDDSEDGSAAPRID